MNVARVVVSIVSSVLLAAEARSQQVREPLALLAEPEYRHVTGRLVRAADGSAFTGPATLRWWSPDGSGSEAETTCLSDERGHFDIPDVPTDAERLVVTFTASRIRQTLDLFSLWELVTEPVHQSVALPPGRQDVPDLEIRLQTGLKLTGVVVDTDEQPVSGVRVKIQHAPDAVTNSRGEFTFLDLPLTGPRAPMPTWFHHEDWPSHQQVIPTGSDMHGTVGPLLVEMKPAPSIQGRVTDELGHPVAGATVDLIRRTRHLKDPLQPTAMSAPDGRYCLFVAGHEAGDMVVARSKDRPVVRVRGYEVGADGVAKLDITMPDGVRLHGLVSDEEGRGLAGVELALGTSSLVVSKRAHTGNIGHHDPIHVASTVSGPDGRYVFEGAGSGRMELTVTSAPDGLALPHLRLIGIPESGEPIEENVQLRRTITLEGSVVDTQGSPLQGAEVALGRNTSLTDERGRFLLTGVLPRGHTLKVRHSGHEDGEARWKPGDPPARITLRPTLTMHGLVTDAESGLPVHHYTVMSVGHFMDTKVVSTLDGRFEGLAVVPEMRLFQVMATGYHGAHLEADVETFRANADRPLLVALRPVH